MLAILSCTARPPREQAASARLAADDTVIERSGRISVAAGVLIDAAGDGVLRIERDGVVLELDGLLSGAPADAAPDSLRGVGIVIRAKNVTLRRARVAGFRVGIHAVGADGLVLEDCDVSGNFRQHLRSTPEKEAEEDWLTPHDNDAHEWFERYGAGIYVERSSGVTVRRCRARDGQNGLVLDRVEHAAVEDNDFSFLSGWGIALWRSSDNVIARNACDFCIRGYSHGVYNRGQDSAGLLLFEQCSRNVIAENSATHCGDGFFGFAGQEALGSAPPPSPDFDHTRRGCNDNVIQGNDFSFAAAHGLELTFSFGNRILSNRFTSNAICGIWGGYSRDTWIVGNEFRANGDAGYGLERGGVNVEHGQRIVIQDNRFRENRCGVHLWWDEDPGIAELPWARANGLGSLDNCISGNTFDHDALALHLRATPGTRVHANEFDDVTSVVDASSGSEPLDEPCALSASVELRELSGDPRPQRWSEQRGGRDLIRVGEWGPLEPAGH